MTLAGMPNLDPLPSGLSAKEIIVWSIQRWIARGALPPGGRLPPVRQLATHFTVDKNTAAKSCRILLASGVVRRVGQRNRAHLEVAPRPVSHPLSHTVIVITSLHPDQIAGPAAPGRGVRVIAGLLEGLREAGLDVLFAHPDVVGPERFTAWAGGYPAGLILAGPLSPEVLALLASQQRPDLPIIAHADLVDLQSADRVGSDHAAGGAALVAHLASRGRRRLAPLVPSDLDQLPWLRARLDGYREGATRCGIELLPERIVPCAADASDKAFRDVTPHLAGALADLLTGPLPPDALIALNDGHAVCVSAACRLLHRAVPTTVAVAGYDHLLPDLTPVQRDGAALSCTMDKNNEVIGRELARLLIERRAGRLPTLPQQVLIPPRLIDWEK